MGSVTQNIFKFFRGSSPATGEVRTGRETGSRTRRHSSGFKEFMRAVSRTEEGCFLDLGPTSATNISLLTERGLKIYTEDLLSASTEPELMVKGDDGAKIIDVDKFLKESIPQRGPTFDAVFFWDIADYLPEPLVKPVIER